MEATIPAILRIIGGLPALIGDLGIAVVGTIIAGIFGLLLGEGPLGIGLACLAPGVDCFRDRPWVWTVGVIFLILSIIMGLLSLLSGAASAVIAMIILYLSSSRRERPETNLFFKKFLF